MPKRAAIVLFLILAFFAYNAYAKVVYEHIYLVPAGNVDGKVVETIRRDLPKILPMAVRIEISPREKILESSYDHSRKQYDADVILKDISKRTYLDTRVESALVITDVDIYSSGADFVLGVSDKSKLTGLISLERLRNEFYGQKPDNKIFLQRVMRQAAHEMGRAWGLSDCQDKKCAMHSSDKLEDITKNRILFCHDCKNKMRERYIAPLVKAAAPVLR